MNLTPTPVWFIAIPLLFAFLSPWFGRARPTLLFLIQAGLLALALSFLPTVGRAPLLETIVIAPPLGIHLHLDAVALLLVTLFSLAGTVVGAFLALGGGPDTLRGRAAFILILLLIAGCNGMVLTGDIFNLYVFLEITSISAYGLAALRRDAAALEAGFKYLLIGSVAATFVLLGILMLYLTTGTLNLAALALAFPSLSVPMQLLIGLTMLLGLAIKTEQFPFNFWVPDIYRGADPVASGLFSGVVVKAFLFVLFHLVFLLLADPSALSPWLMATGGLTMLIAEWTALRQRDLRRVLAYSSLGQVGLIAMALGFGNEMVSAGALFHMVNHTLVKLLSFLVAGLFIARHGGGTAAKLTGAGRAMPLAAALFVLAALSVLGLPPLAGFASKFWMLSGFAAAQVWWPIALVLIGALLEAAYYFRWIAVLYGTGAGAERSPTPPGPLPPRLAWLPLLTLAGLLVLGGLAPFLIEDPLNAASVALLGRTATIEAVLGAHP